MQTIDSIFLLLLLGYIFQTFKGSPEEEGTPITIPVHSDVVPLKEMDIKIKVTNEDGEAKPIKAIDVSVKGCLLGMKNHLKIHCKKYEVAHF